MHPTLLSFDSGVEGVGVIALPSYFALLAVGFGLATFLAWRWGGRTGVKRDAMVDLGLYMVVYGVLGARLLHVVADGEFWNYVHWCTDPDAVVWERLTELECRSEAYDGIWNSVESVCRPRDPASRPAWERCTLWLQFWQGGLAYYGGFLLATLFGIRFLRKEGLPIRHVVDMAGWAIPFGLAWGRLGCFLNGCCYGATVASEQGASPWWAVAFPRWSPAWLDHLREELVSSSSTASIPVHATQLYESLACLAIAAAAYLYVGPRRRFAGEVFLSSCVMYAVARFLLEFFRRDPRGELLGLSTSQLIGVAVVVAVAVAWPRVKGTAPPGARGA